MREITKKYSILMITDEVMAGFKKSKKAGADEIPAATQLFTPDWIVRYLVQNTVGRLWTQNHPESQLHNTWEYYIDPVGEDAGEILKIDSPEDLTVCDPACGSGHMLTYCLCSISCCGFSHDDFSGLGRACRPRNGLNWMVLVSPPERTGKDYDQHAPSTVYPSFAAERGIRRVDRAENTCQRADGA